MLPIEAIKLCLGSRQLVVGGLGSWWLHGLGLQGVGVEFMLEGISCLNIAGWRGLGQNDRLCRCEKF